MVGFRLVGIIVVY